MQVGETITENNSSSCPDAAQYYGKIVNGVDRLLTIGAFRFPLSAFRKTSRSQASKRKQKLPLRQDHFRWTPFSSVDGAIDKRPNAAAQTLRRCFAGAGLLRRNNDLLRFHDAAMSGVPRSGGCENLSDSTTAHYSYLGYRPRYAIQLKSPGGNDSGRAAFHSSLSRF
jgi:hypothetical protein